MLHPIQCSCFNCRNGYTPIEDRAIDTTRKYKKPTGKRPNRTKKIDYRNMVRKSDRDEYGKFMRFWNGI